MARLKSLIAVIGLLCLVLIWFFTTGTAMDEQSKQQIPDTHPQNLQLQPAVTEQGEDLSNNLEKNFPTGRILILKDAAGLDLREHMSSKIGDVIIYAELPRRKRKNHDVAVFADRAGKSCRETNPGILWSDHKYKCLKVFTFIKFKPKNIRGADISLSEVGDVRIFDFFELDLTRKEFEAELAQGRDRAQEAYAKQQARLEAYVNELNSKGTTQ